MELQSIVNDIVSFFSQYDWDGTVGEPSAVEYLAWLTSGIAALVGLMSIFISGYYNDEIKEAKEIRKKIAFLKKEHINTYCSHVNNKYYYTS